jgi:hypothetical protein
MHGENHGENLRKFTETAQERRPRAMQLFFRGQEYL